MGSPSESERTTQEDFDRAMRAALRQQEEIRGLPETEPEEALEGRVVEKERFKLPPGPRQIDYEAILRKPIWNTQDVVDYFGLKSKQVIYKWIQEGKAPPRFRLGKELKWDRQELITWFAEHREEI